MLCGNTMQRSPENCLTPLKIPPDNPRVPGAYAKILKMVWSVTRAIDASAHGEWYGSNRLCLTVSRSCPRDKRLAQLASCRARDDPVPEDEVMDVLARSRRP
jgi:hypothetical protein